MDLDAMYENLTVGSICFDIIETVKSIATCTMTNVDDYSDTINTGAPHIYSLPMDALTVFKNRMREDDPAFLKLIADCDKLLKKVPQSVMDKPTVPVSMDKHDYISFAPYFWPDPSKPDGLPYIRRDGERNPESKDGTDSAAFHQTCDAIFSLGLAYWFTNDEKYAEKAAQLTRVWFLDFETRMNPHLEFAQAVRGLNNGRYFGVLEGRKLTIMNDGITFITPSNAWTEQDSLTLGVWMHEYYIWLTTRKFGVESKLQKNNHGSWYDVQAAHLALVVGRPREARYICETAKTMRIDVQIESDGSQPYELARVKSLDYAIFNLEALTRLAIIGEFVGVSLWDYKSRDGRSLIAAINFLAPYVDPSKKWMGNEVKLMDRQRILPLLAEAHRNSKLQLSQLDAWPADSRASVEVTSSTILLGDDDDDDTTHSPVPARRLSTKPNVMDHSYYRDLITTHITVESRCEKWNLWCDIVM